MTLTEVLAEMERLRRLQRWHEAAAAGRVIAVTNVAHADDVTYGLAAASRDAQVPLPHVVVNDGIPADTIYLIDTSIIEEGLFGPLTP